MSYKPAATAGRLYITSPRFAFAALACPRCGLFTAILNTSCAVYKNTRMKLNHPGVAIVYMSNSSELTVALLLPSSECVKKITPRSFGSLDKTLTTKTETRTTCTIGPYDFPFSHSLSALSCIPLLLTYTSYLL
ncbi:hypothetical protein PQ469_22265 [Mucilaginibacter sp. KACC 22773]|uniref:hypothetical protein n=1 Tax=Mucilaginibacter sp. KACC 22773 TaxID=3025671 RepID=UPI0023667C00|nr:hypothetical protein [Mucilaginibacter sp. KACC 22773]WDF76615.1 hypothetical protein PQ469_22265 [Mucilaginibacter sp. KACC 22773]